jgi:general L-amino acid transport system substrate-binding protein
VKCVYIVYFLIFLKEYDMKQLKHTLKQSLGTVGAATLLAAAMLAPAHAGKTLDNVRSKGVLTCGVNTGLAGFAQADSTGNWSGLDVDTCKAVAAAVLGDGNKVKYVPLTAQQRFTALQSGEIDLLARNTTFTLSRDASLGISVTAVTYYDGQGFLVPASKKIKSPKQLKGQTVCVQSGTTTEKNLSDYSKANGLGLKTVVFEKLEAATQAYFSGRCVAYTADGSALASIRTKEAKNPTDHVILPELISKEPLGPMVRRGDEDFKAVVTWVIHGLVEAEEYGIKQGNVEAMKTSTDPVIQRLLGTGSDDTGKLLGLKKDWLANALKTSGNYGEIFERNVGAQSAIKLPRGSNNLWNKGGLMYSPPLR